MKKEVTALCVWVLVFFIGTFTLKYDYVIKLQSMTSQAWFENGYIIKLQSMTPRVWF